MQGGRSRVTAMCAGSTKSQVTADGMKPSVTLAAFTELGLTILPPAVTSLESAIQECLKSELLTSYMVGVPLPPPPKLLCVHHPLFRYVFTYEAYSSCRLGSDALQLSLIGRSGCFKAGAGMGFLARAGVDAHQSCDSPAVSMDPI